MPNKCWLLSTALWAAAPAFAQDAAAAPATAPAEAAAAPAAASPDPNGEIVVAATRRAQTLSSVPIAVSAVGGEAMRAAGATDLRGLSRLSPSLFVSSSSSEAVGGAARIRGIGTVGDNPGLESSVATFVDGVYRNRSGVALTELGAVDRVEVLRGPQGTLFGRNASAGLINVITVAPSFEEGGTAEFEYGNYDYKRATLGLTGPITPQLAYRLDGVYTKRDGFLKEGDDYAGSTGRRFNGRDRWLVRGQLLYNPTDAMSLRIIGDYSKRNEECCAATLLPARDVIRDASGNVSFAPSSFAALERSLGGAIEDDTFKRRVAVTPGRSFQSDVRDWGGSAELNWDLGGAKLTAITAYRDWRSDRSQDADFSNLDITYRDQYDQEFKTFTQEVRLQGKALNDRLDWLVGGYFADERLSLTDDLRFGNDYGRLQACRVLSGAIPALGLPAATFSPASPGCINPAIRPAIAAAFPAAAAPVVNGLLGSLDRLRAIGDSGASLDRFHQKDRTWALFTHNVIDLTGRLSLTLGARYTHDGKRLDAAIASNTNVCTTQAATSNALATQIAAGAAGGVISAAQAATLTGLARSIQSLACANNIGGGVDGAYRDRLSDGEWSGTAVLSYKPVDALLTYASYSRGYKAGGFNLDRAGLTNPSNPASPGIAANVNQLPFSPEKVDSFEVGAKYRGRGFRVAAAAFYELFRNFQLNTFNGISFIVENIQGCGALAGGSGADGDLSDTTGACTGKSKAGVVSRGIELEGSLYPVPDVSLDAGFTLADTQYRGDLSGRAGRPLPSSLFQLPGSRLSNAPLYTATGAATWRPAIGRSLRGLVHADARYQSGINTGSDLLPEKVQKGFAVVDARVGVSGADDGWSLEFWAQNLFDTDYLQVAASAPLQGSGSLATVRAGGAVPGNSLFLAFLGEPRTYGLTLRTKF